MQEKQKIIIQFCIKIKQSSIVEDIVFRQIVSDSPIFQKFQKEFLDYLSQNIGKTQ